MATMMLFPFQSADIMGRQPYINTSAGHFGNIKTLNILSKDSVPVSDSRHDNGTSDGQDGGRKEQCKVCMWTGVATCAGLSIYFLKQAYLDLPETRTAEAMKQAQKQRRFLVLLAGTSTVAGAYRFYLG